MNQSINQLVESEICLCTYTLARDAFMLIFCPVFLKTCAIFNTTRMHSSGMHTARLLTVPSMHCAGGVSARGGGCLPNMQWARPPPCGQTPVKT